MFQLMKYSKYHTIFFLSFTLEKPNVQFLILIIIHSFQCIQTRDEGESWGSETVFLSNISVIVFW